MHQAAGLKVSARAVGATHPVIPLSSSAPLPPPRAALCALGKPLCNPAPPTSLGLWAGRGRGKVDLEGSKLMGGGGRPQWASLAQGCACLGRLGSALVTQPHTQPQLQPPKLSRAGGFLSFSYKQTLNLKVRVENYPRHKNSHWPQSQWPTLWPGALKKGSSKWGPECQHFPGSPWVGPWGPGGGRGDWGALQPLLSPRLK